MRKLPSTGLTDDDGESLMNCPVCGLVLDTRDMEDVIAHAHGGQRQNGIRV
jgi:uncharacterized C2H2 Zn-finger protein